MSNKVTIQPTKFSNLGGSEVTWGVRVYDEYDSSYDNTWEQSEVDCFFNHEKQIYEQVDPLSILAKVCMTENEVIDSMIEYVIENETGIWIGSDWFEWEQIKEVVVGPV